MYKSEVAWWKDRCRTSDKKTYSYSGTEYSHSAGASTKITFKDFGSFTGYSEEAAIKAFQDWYDKYIKTKQPNM